MAALEQRLGKGQGRERLETLARAVSREPPRPLPAGTVNRVVRCAEDPKTVGMRQARLRALLLKRAYAIEEWLPFEAVLHLRRVDVHPDGRFIWLTLWSGTQILDTGDRISVRGTADDVAVAELVACVGRRGWQVVVVDGDEAFRVAAARELMRQGIEVVDSPLDADEQAELRQEAEGLGFDWESVEQVPAPAPRPPWVHG